MISSPFSVPRLLIPRWRGVTSAIAEQELAIPKRGEVPSSLAPELQKRLAAWRRHRSVISAAEVLESAVIAGQVHLATDAARYLVDESSGATALLREQAARVLGVGKRPAAEDRPDNPIAFWRRWTVKYPRNALAWVELAFAYTSAGKADGAMRAMAVALQLEPTNRYALRSASRLYTHCQEIDRAYDLIRKNSRTPSDPWLIAAEIALAERAGRKSFFMKKGLSILQHDAFAPRQITELAGAAGTTCLNAGDHKRGKRLFRQSMLDPTANALAQAEYESQRSNECFLQESQLQRASDAKEALTLHTLGSGDYSTSFFVAKQWIEEEPFSNRAYRAAVSAANAVESYAEAINLAEKGLRYNYGSIQLYNSLAFAWASCDDLNKAEQALRKVQSLSPDIVSNLVAKANKGLVEMRKGNLEIGEKYYRDTINEFTKPVSDDLRANSYFMYHSEQLKCCAFAYFSREAVRARHPNSGRILSEARGALLNAKKNRHHERFSLSELVLSKAELAYRSGNGLQLEVRRHDEALRKRQA